MSDTEQPSEAAILKKLQDVVVSLHKSGNTNDLTVKRVRTRAEESLGLPAGLLKGADWKQRSQDAIMEAVDKYCGDEPEPEPVKPAPKTSKPKAPTKKVESKAQSKQGAKRKAAAPKKQPQKRRKTASSEDELSDELSDAESEPADKPAQRAKNVIEEDSDEEEAAPKKPTKKAKPVVEDEGDSDAEPATTPAKKAKTPPPADEGAVSESELSSLLDESPVKNKRQKKAPAAKKEPAKPKAKATSKAADDPDQAEIKRLQSWLVKCGIRKVWSKELAKFDTSKEKIRHLKRMLSDAGMDGRFSDEKAAKIKERREFAKDLEAIQEGEASWGTSEDTGGRPRRRAAARPVPVQKIEFSDDDEESEGNKDDADESSEDDQDDDDEDDGEGPSEDGGGDDSAADDSE
ncbi:hypothetical protein BU25DRAFT_454910 [Macroventuria anomochaeta]|uniref:Uncharacterized protein n=1 Tax=Macroventuria anomochaeta TaxID=301207 RepID=A0ACB6SDQ2_9PLEO|nr:uncharacterized protein BU25DRAFT_454910 [Macroventuria anomochaeta]KAF2631463.1 hypothetical protein BU25DRAFT_454910 [Macroventuria anomochaeta]